MPQKLEFTLFGSLGIRQAGVPLSDFKSAKAQALVCYLALTGRAHSRPALAGLLWGDMPDGKARMNLSQALSTLRRYFKPHLDITRHAIALRLGSDIWVDVNTFESAVAGGGIESMDKAIRLYRGDLLDDFIVRNAPDFEMWLVAERTRLRELAVKTHYTLAYHHARRGEPDWGRAFDHTSRLLDLEPWHEDAHCLLMRLLALDGRRNAALLQYERCRQVLADEVGVEPEAGTTALYNQIRENETVEIPLEFETLIVRGGLNAGIKSSRQAIETRLPYSTNLPPLQPGFIGREAELTLLEGFLTDQATRLVTIVGPGGIGKTRLALEFANLQLRLIMKPSPLDSGPSHSFSNGIFFVSLESIEAGESILPAIAEVLSFRLDADEAQLFDFLSSRHLLLILDNFEHLLDATDILSRILVSAPGVHILITSRERLGLRGEQVLPLQGLEYPETTKLRQMPDFPAGKLFLQSARRKRPDFRLQEPEVEDLLHLCKLLEGMPLALELAATWTDTLPIVKIITEIQHNLDFLTTELRDMPARHRSIRAAFDTSWNRLSTSEQTIFSQLSVFKGGFTRQAAAAITGATIHDLSAFVGKSLLRYNKFKDRYEVHELLRQYARADLAAQASIALKTHDIHSKYFCQWLADQATPRSLKFFGQKSVLDRMAQELENVRAAWIWALQNQRIDRLLPGTTTLGMYYVWRGGYREGERAFRSYSGMLSDGVGCWDPLPARLRVDFLNWNAFFSYQIGERENALDLLNGSRHLSDSLRIAGLDTRAERAHNLRVQALADWSQTEEHRFQYSTEALALYRQVEHPYGLAETLNTCARLAILTGRLDAARRLLEESLDINSVSGNQLGRSASLTGLGNLAFTQNDYAKAGALLEQSLDIAQAMCSLERSIVASLYLGCVYVFTGKFRQAQDILEGCVADTTNQGLYAWRATSLYYLGFTLLHLGEYDRATTCAQAALPIVKQTDDREFISLSISLPAAVALAKGAYQQAFRGFEEAARTLDSKRSAWVIFGEDCTLVGIGTALMQLDRFADAMPVFTNLLQQAVNSHRQDQLLYALAGFAILLAKRGYPDRAAELYSQAASYPFVGNSHWFQDVFGRHIQATRTDLSALSLEGSKAQDDQGDMWSTAAALLLESIAGSSI